MKIDYKKLYESRIREIEMQMIRTKINKDWKKNAKLIKERNELLKKINALG